MICSFLRADVRAMFAATAISALATSASAAESPFPTLAGSWVGSGQVRLEGGKTEGIKCKGYYTTKAGGAELGLAIRCASASNKIEMRANLAYSGGAVSGNWEERTFNAAGNVNGKASDNRISLAITGGGLNGQMAVNVAGGSHSVTISTEGSTFKGIRINFSRG